MYKSGVIHKLKQQENTACVVVNKRVCARATAWLLAARATARVHYFSILTHVIDKAHYEIAICACASLSHSPLTLSEHDSSLLPARLCSRPTGKRVYCIFVCRGRRLPPLDCCSLSPPPSDHEINSDNVSGTFARDFECARARAHTCDKIFACHSRVSKAYERSRRANEAKKCVVV
jgi:hypothetical protein